MQLADYIGQPVSLLLGAAPFKDWSVERSVEHDLDEPIVEYVFKGHGLELRCNGDEIIRAMFLYSETYGGFNESLFEIPFSATREAVLEHYGRPNKSGKPLEDPVLGEYGPWDRFAGQDGIVVHVQYRVSANAVDKFTLMRADEAP